MEQFVQCVNLEFEFDRDAQADKLVKESEIAINTRYIMRAGTSERTIMDGDEKKGFKYYIITMYYGEILYVKRDPHLIAIFGV